MTIARFWRETGRRYNLGGSQCTNCRTVYFPPRSVCPTCAKHRQTIGKLVPFQLSGDGEVETFTIVHEPAEGFEMEVPYVLALVRTPEGPVLTGQVVDVNPGEVKIGLKVHAAFRKLREEGKAGVIHYGYKFAPRSDPESRPKGPSPDSAPVPQSTERPAAPA